MIINNAPEFRPDLQLSKLKSLPPLSLYIHIPWCIKKCPYCDFNSHAIREEENQMPEEEYADALLHDLESTLPNVWGRRLSSVFFGGGTPSLFSAKTIDKILTGVRTLLPLEHFSEVTLEANPGTIEAGKFKEFRDAGINRLSLGIQSFNPQHLNKLGRVHDDQQAYRAVEIALKNFDNINLDLMYALPMQTVAEAQADIAVACSLGVTHISAYHLTLEPNTLFYRFPPNLPDEEHAAQMQDIIEQTAADHGYRNYETSAFAWNGKESRHNMNYWLFGDYVGIGAGAHSKISFADKILRQMRYKHPKEYLNRNKAGVSLMQMQHELTSADRSFEFMMNALRLTGGFDVTVFQERTGLPIKVVSEQLNEAEQRGLLIHDDNRIKPTVLGRRFLNDLLQIFLPENNIS